MDVGITGSSQSILISRNNNNSLRPKNNGQVKKPIVERTQDAYWRGFERFRHMISCTTWVPKVEFEDLLINKNNKSWITTEQKKEIQTFMKNVAELNTSHVSNTLGNWSPGQVLTLLQSCFVEFSHKERLGAYHIKDRGTVDNETDDNLQMIRAVNYCMGKMKSILNSNNGVIDENKMGEMIVGISNIINSQEKNTNDMPSGAVFKCPRFLYGNQLSIEDRHVSFNNEHQDHWCPYPQGHLIVTGKKNGNLGTLAAKRWKDLNVKTAKTADVFKIKSDLMYDHLFANGNGRIADVIGIVWSLLNGELPPTRLTDMSGYVTTNVQFSRHLTGAIIKVINDEGANIAHEKIRSLKYMNEAIKDYIKTVLKEDNDKDGEHIYLDILFYLDKTKQNPSILGECFMDWIKEYMHTAQGFLGPPILNAWVKTLGKNGFTTDDLKLIKQRILINDDCICEEALMTLIETLGKDGLTGDILKWIKFQIEEKIYNGVHNSYQKEVLGSLIETLGEDGLTGDTLEWIDSRIKQLPPSMLEMRTVLKKIQPEENCYRYFEMTLFQKNQGYYVEFKWGRLHESIVPKWVKRKELKFTDSNEALKVVMKKLKEKQGRGYLVGE